MYDWSGANEDNKKNNAHIVHVIWKRGSSSYQGLCGQNSSDIFLNALKKTKAEHISMSLLSQSSIKPIRSQLGGRYFSDALLEKYLTPTKLEHVKSVKGKSGHLWWLVSGLMLLIALVSIYIGL